MVKLEIVEHGVMLSQYFSGTSGVMLSIPVDRETTPHEILTELENEIDLLWDHVSYTAEFHGLTDSDDLQRQIDDQIAEMRSFVISKGDSEKPCESCKDLDYLLSDLDDCDEPCVMIFSIEFEDQGDDEE